MIGKSPLEKAQADVEKARTDLAHWQAQKLARSAELVDLEGRLGDDVLAAGDAAEQAAGRLATQVAALRAAVDVAARTADAAQRRLEQSERIALGAEADELDERAAALDRDADRREVRTQDLLRQLRDHEAVDYAPAPLDTPDGTARRGFAPRTRTQALQAEATGLRRQALVLRHTAQDGTVPTFVPGEPDVQTAPLLTDSLRAFRAARQPVAV